MLRPRALTWANFGGSSMQPTESNAPPGILPGAEIPTVVNAPVSTSGIC